MPPYSSSNNARNTIQPPIPQARAWAAAYRSTDGKPLLNLAQGIPGSPPPQSLISSFEKAIRDNESFGYGPVPGESALRSALVDEMREVYGPVDISVDDVLVSTGCNMAFVAAVMSLADAGDEVVLPVPWYFNHQMALSMLGVKTVELPTLPENAFQPSVKDCAALITPKTKAIALVTPNNPTGAIYPPDLLTSFLDLARQHGIALILDETYRDYVPGHPHSLFATEWRSNLIHLFSFSKSYHVPGLRLGAVIANPDHHPALIAILDTIQICASTPAQLALAPVVPTMRTFIASQAKLLDEKHQLFRDHLPPSWTVGSQGGFYAYVRHPFEDLTAEHVCQQLASKLGVVLLPSSFFGTPNERWIRVAVANVSKEEIIQACQRLATCAEHFGWKETQAVARR